MTNRTNTSGFPYRTRGFAAETCAFSYGEREILHGISFDVVRRRTLVILGVRGLGQHTFFPVSVSHSGGGSKNQPPCDIIAGSKAGDSRKPPPRKWQEIRGNRHVRPGGRELCSASYYLLGVKTWPLPLREHTRPGSTPTMKVHLRLKLQHSGSRMIRSM